MNSSLKSHPHLFLHEHINQVRKACWSIKQWHSHYSINSRIRQLTNLAAQLHDTGKGTRFFQEYIQDPDQYRGDPQNKAHTTLSLLLTLAAARWLGLDPLDGFILAAVTVGHHSELPTVPERRLGGVICPKRDINSFTGGDKARLLKKQLNNLDLAALAQETEVDWRAIAEEPEETFREAKRYLEREVLPRFAALNLEEGVTFRLVAQLVFSLLLESDRALLAISDPVQYLTRDPKPWRSKWIEDRIGHTVSSRTNDLRRQARATVLQVIESHWEEKIFSLTAPTGCGKTLLAATWALKLREGLEAVGESCPRIIIVLPFLSVIDQTIKEYAGLLALGGVELDGSWLMASHSLADRHYADGLADEEQQFLLDTWRSEIVITTYDQFLLSLLDPRARYQMRFHNLCDALIVMDEVQSLPCRLWEPMGRLLKGLVEVGNSRVLLMSATLPPFVYGAVPLLPDYGSYFRSFGRYRLLFQINQPQGLEEFIDSLVTRLPGWLTEARRVMVTLNTRKSARKIRDALFAEWPEEYRDIPLLFISADVTPRDRLAAIARIKAGGPCLVVSTQCVEAGVDIDMDLVIRDFAPLDSLIQIAGRCNREGRQSQRGTVEIVDLINENDRRYSEYIYDPVHLAATRELIGDVVEVKEEEVLDLSDRYFSALAAKKDTGRVHVERFARWQEDLPVAEILRGKERFQWSFLVIEQDPMLLEAMQAAASIEDRWERREAWRRLAGRLAKISVSIFALPGFSPQQIANPFLEHWWILREGYYSSSCGLNMEGETLIL